MQALYSWWQYELCDVFIELVKPVMARSSSEEGADAEKQAFRETLWTCLDKGLGCECCSLGDWLLRALASTFFGIPLAYSMPCLGAALASVLGMLQPSVQCSPQGVTVQVL